MSDDQKLQVGRVEASNLLARAWQDWLQSNEGQSCASEGSTIVPGMARFVENRLWHAFMAGASASLADAKGREGEAREALRVLESSNLLRCAAVVYCRHCLAEVGASPSHPFIHRTDCPFALLSRKGS
jgi:hypothetical protein